MAQILGRESKHIEDMSRGVDLVMAPAGISVRIRRPKIHSVQGRVYYRWLNLMITARQNCTKCCTLLSQAAVYAHVLWFQPGHEGRELGHWSVLDMDLLPVRMCRFVEKYLRTHGEPLFSGVQDFAQEFVVAEGFADGITNRRTRKRLDGQRG